MKMQIVWMQIILIKLFTPTAMQICDRNTGTHSGMLLYQLSGSLSVVELHLPLSSAEAAVLP